MKKICLSILSVIILTSCSRGNFTSEVSLIEDGQPAIEQQEVKTLADIQSENTINESKDFVASTAESLFLENFADDVETPIVNKIVNPSILKNVETKGGKIFNILNKSKFAQKVAYFFADIPVKKWMNMKGKPDTTPRITEAQIAELKATLKPGDLILCGNNKSFIHAILYVGDDVIIHSLASSSSKYWGVIRETLGEYLYRSERDKFVVLRSKNFDPAEFSKTVDYANKQIGKKYDTLFLMNSDSKFYCTELVYQALMQMPSHPRMYSHKVKLGWQLVTNEDFMDSPDFETVWSLNKVRPETGKLHQYN